MCFVWIGEALVHWGFVSILRARGLERLDETRSAVRDEGRGGGLFGPHLLGFCAAASLVDEPSFSYIGEMMFWFGSLWMFFFSLWICVMRYATMRCALLSLRSYGLPWPIRDCVIMLYVQVWK